MEQPPPQSPSLSHLLEIQLPWQTLFCEEEGQTASLLFPPSCLFSGQCGGWGNFFNYFERRGGVDKIHFRNLTIQVTHKHLNLPRRLFLEDPGSGGFREMQAQDPTPEPGSGE